MPRRARSGGGREREQPAKVPTPTGTPAKQSHYGHTASTHTPAPRNCSTPPVCSSSSSISCSKTGTMARFRTHTQGAGSSRLDAAQRMALQEGALGDVASAGSHPGTPVEDLHDSRADPPVCLCIRASCATKGRTRRRMCRCGRTFSTFRAPPRRLSTRPYPRTRQHTCPQDDASHIHPRARAASGRTPAGRPWNHQAPAWERRLWQMPAACGGWPPPACCTAGPGLL